MHRNAVTERYLEAVARTAFGPDELTKVSRQQFDLDNTTYFGEVLPRPSFVSYAERERLAGDLHALVDALAALPDRLFGSDFAAFAKATGMTDAQVEGISRIRSKELTRLTRADMYHDGTDFKIMELNMGSTTGGLDNGMVNRAALTLPFVAEFAEANDLSYVDGLAELASMFRAEVQAGEGERILAVVVDIPENLRFFQGLLTTSANDLAEHGVDFVPCHFEQLRYSRGRVLLEDRPIDLVYRLVAVEDLLRPEVAELIEPLMSAVERGDVRLFTPMDTDAYASKAALAMLSDEANRHLLTPAQARSLDRLLPWTRMVRDEPVTVDGERVDLLQFAAQERGELVLKPTLLHGGLGVTLGWQCDLDTWTKQVHAAVDGPYVLQRRVRAAPELVPTPQGVQPMVFNWGVFTVASGYGGALVRGTTTLDGSVLNRAGGAALGCCFHETRPAG